MELKGKMALPTWKRSLGKLLKSDNVTPTERSGDTIELQNFVMVISSPLKNLEKIVEFENSRGIDYTTKSYRKYWQSVDDRLSGFASNGGKIDQTRIIAEKLGNSSYSRQAYATIWSPEIDSVSPYPFCIVGVYCFIRDDALNMTSILRSNDAWGQALNDIYHLVKIQEKLSKKLGVSMGTYTHIAMSYHIYVSDLIKAKIFLEG